jgi:hypothetical protein
VTDVVLVYLTLSFPTGRLPARTDRLLVAAMGAVVLVMYMPRLFVAGAFEVPSAFTSCVRPNDWGSPTAASFAKRSLACSTRSPALMSWRRAAISIRWSGRSRPTVQTSW